MMTLRRRLKVLGLGLRMPSESLRIDLERLNKLRNGLARMKAGKKHFMFLDIDAYTGEEGFRSQKVSSRELWNLLYEKEYNEHVENLKYYIEDVKRSIKRNMSAIRELNKLRKVS
jgi:hypothetical protein